MLVQHMIAPPCKHLKSLPFHSIIACSKQHRQLYMDGCIPISHATRLALIQTHKLVSCAQAQTLHMKGGQLAGAFYEGEMCSIQRKMFDLNAECKQSGPPMLF